MAPSHPSARSRRARLAFEYLESRDVPAGIITVSAVNGVVALIGDDFDNFVSVSMTTGANPTVTLTPDSTTTIDDLAVTGPGKQGDPVTLKVSMHDLHFVAKGGNDTFEVTDPNGLQLTGGLMLDMGDGDNTVKIDTDGLLSLGDFSVTAGDGFDTCVVTAREASSGMATGRRSHKPVTFSLGDGGFDATISNFQIPGSGGMSFTDGDCDDGNALGGSFVATRLTMDGPFTGQTGGGVCSWSFGASNCGTMSMGSAGSGRLSVGMTNNTHVKGDLKISTPGDLSLGLDHTTVDKSVKVQKLWTPANFRTSVDMTVSDCPSLGSVQISSAGGSTAAAMQMFRTTVAGSISVSNTGPNGLAVFDAVDVACGAISVQAIGVGSTTASASFAGSCTVASCAVKSTDTTNVEVSGTLFLGVQGAAQATGNMSVSAGAGIADLNIAGGGGGAAGGGGSFRASSLSVSAGGGVNVDMTQQANLQLAKAMILSSPEYVVVADLDGDGLVDIVGPVSVTGTDEASLTAGDSWTSGPVSVVSTMGPAICTFAPTTLKVSGDLTVFGGFLTNVTIAPKSAGTWAGSIKTKGGSGDDLIQIQDVDGLKDVSVDMGNGNNSMTLRKSFVLPHVLEVSGKLSVTDGSGAGRATFQDLSVTGVASLKMGGGKDTLTVDACEFKSAFGADLGSGDDQVLIGLLLKSDSPVVFDAPTTIGTGAGNDSMQLGIKDDPNNPDDDNSRVQFKVAGNKIDGGLGVNTYDPEASHVDGLDATSLLHWSAP
jgi:hypothetical protein